MIFYDIKKTEYQIAITTIKNLVNKKNEPEIKNLEFITLVKVGAKQPSDNHSAVLDIFKAVVGSLVDINDLEFSPVSEYLENAPSHASQNNFLIVVKKQSY